MLAHAAPPLRRRSVSDSPKLLTPQETAELLHVAVATLAIWRCTKRYPLPYRKHGRKVLYVESDVLKFSQEGEKR